jgi:ABC-type uncharacterized transport system substrate-binding protein
MKGNIMANAKKAVSKAVNKALKQGAEPVVEITAATAKMIAAVRKHAEAQAQAWWKGAAKLSDNKIATIISGALTTKTAIKKTARHLYGEADPYGRIAAAKARATEQGAA